MKLTKRKMLGAGLFMATALLVLAPQPLRAGTAEQMDGVMGQSIVEETESALPLNNSLLKATRTYTAPTLLKESSYTDDFLDSSFTTEGNYTSSTYYHKGDYEDYNLFNGIDVSWWQGEGGKNSTESALDWEQIHSSGIDFAFVRVASRDTADGSLYEDTCGDSHIQGALENDINVGLYVFSQALTEEEAVEEAEYVLELADAYGWDVTMPIVIDREPGSYKRLTAGKLSKAKETAVCQAFADTITDAGYQACVYAAYSWIKSYINTDSLDNCGIWIARYNSTTTSNSKSGTAYSDVAYDYDFWQYSSVGKVSGYSGSLDVNFWYKDTSVQTTGLKMTANTTSSVSLSWNAAGDAYAYRVYRYDSEQEKYVYLATTKKRSYIDSGLSAGTTYQYRVRGYWPIGGTNYYGAYSSPVVTTTVSAQVTNVNVKSRTSTSLELEWDAVTGASGYRIYQYNSASGKYEKVTDVTGEATSYKLSGLPSATEHLFKVRAYMNTDSGTFWGVSSVAVGTVTSPSQVNNLTMAKNTSTSITMKWGKVSGVTGYQVYRLNTKTGKYERLITIKDEKILSYTNTGLTPGKEYTFKVRAYKSYNGKNYYGRLSDPTSAIARPAKVKTLKLSTKSSSVTLAWSQVSEATGYQVYCLNTKTGKYEKVQTIKDGTVCTYQHTKLKKGSTYTYKVRAYRSYEGKTHYGVFSPAVKIQVK